MVSLYFPAICGRSDRSTQNHTPSTQTACKGETARKPIACQDLNGRAKRAFITHFYLRWDHIPGAKVYEVFLRNDWEGVEATASGLLTEPRYTPPKGMLQPGGEYVWRIHARDSDGNVLLGDFNHGSLSPEMRFTVK